MQCDITSYSTEKNLLYSKVLQSTSYRVFISKTKREHHKSANTREMGINMLHFAPFCIVSNVFTFSCYMNNLFKFIHKKLVNKISFQ